MSQLDLHGHVVAVLSGLEDLSLVSLRALRESLESRVGIILRDQKREIRHHAENAIAELWGRTCFAEGAAQRAIEGSLVENKPCVAVWESHPHADRGRRLFMESEWHVDVNTLQHWRGVWEPLRWTARGFNHQSSPCRSMPQAKMWMKQVGMDTSESFCLPVMGGINVSAPTCGCLAVSPQRVPQRVDLLGRADGCSKKGFGKFRFIVIQSSTAAVLELISLAFQPVLVQLASATFHVIYDRGKTPSSLCLARPSSAWNASANHSQGFVGWPRLFS